MANLTGVELRHTILLMREEGMAALVEPRRVLGQALPWPISLATRATSRAYACSLKYGVAVPAPWAAEALRPWVEGGRRA